MKGRWGGKVEKVGRWVRGDKKREIEGLRERQRGERLEEMYRMKGRRKK